MRLMEPSPADVQRLLLAAKATVATAESLTGGMLGALLTSVPGASAAYLGGVISYATPLKVEMLGVPSDLVATHGVVSAACAEAMASGVRTLTGATWAVSTTGVAGPDGQEDKPAGTVFVGLAGPDIVLSKQAAFDGDRDEVRRATCTAALELLADTLSTHR